MAAVNTPTSPAPGGEGRAPDPVRAKRAVVARIATAASRAGYLLFALACVVFVVGAMNDFPGWAVGVVVTCLILGSVVLAPAIILGYAVRAAERQDRELGL